MGLEIDTLVTTRDLEAIRPAWDALFDRSATATPFQAPEWQLGWWRHLGGGALRVVTVRRNGRLVAIAPFCVWGGEGQPRCLSLLGSGVSDYEDILVDPDEATVPAALVLQEIAHWRALWDECILQEVPLTSALLTAPAPAVLEKTAVPTSFCSYLSLPHDYAAVEAALTPKFRRNLRNMDHRWQRTQSTGNLACTRAEAANVGRLLQDLFALHGRRWRVRGQPGVLADGRLRRFHREVAMGFQARGMLRLFALALDGKTVAVLYAFTHRRCCYAYLSGIDPAAERLSPGVAILRHVIQQAIAEGLSELDLLRGDEAYKRAWRPTVRRNQRLIFRAAVAPP